LSFQLNRITDLCRGTPLRPILSGEAGSFGSSPYIMRVVGVQPLPRHYCSLPIQSFERHFSCILHNIFVDSYSPIVSPASMQTRHTWPWVYLCYTPVCLDGLRYIACRVTDSFYRPYSCHRT
jgi:hypothetical protein